MADLTGRTPAESYKDLLQISNSNSGVDATLRRVEDGEGTESALSLSTTTAQVTGTMEITGGLTLGGVTVNAGAVTTLSDIAAQNPGTAAAGTSSGASRADHVHNLPAVAVGDSGSGGVKGLVPAPGTGDAAASKFLKADMTYATATAGAFTDSNHIVEGSADATKTLRIEVDGLTGSTERVWTAPDSNLDLTPSTGSFQGADADLTAIAGLTSAADKGIQFTGSGTAGTYDLTTFAKSILDDANEATFKATVNLEIGTDVQAFGAVLDDLNTLGANSADSEFIVGTGSGALAWESGATVRTSLGLAIGTNVLAEGDTGIGKHTISVPAKAMTPTTTNGAASGTTELATNDIMVDSMDFDASTLEKVQFSIAMPKSWNEGNLTATFFWSHPATTTNFDVIWGIKAIPFGNSDAQDTTWGTAVTVTDTGGTTDDLFVTAETSAFAAKATVTENDLVVFEVYRNAADGSDTMGVDARLQVVKINYTTSSGEDT